HKGRRRQKISGTGGKDKAKVIGMVERGGKVRVRHVPDLTNETFRGFVREGAEPGSRVYTDTYPSFSGLDADYAHETVNHAELYVSGQVHTNSMENFWALLKRGLHGTYVSVQPFHLFRYLDERMFTFNERELDDCGRFDCVLRAVAGNRLTFAEVIGKA